MSNPKDPKDLPHLKPRNFPISTTEGFAADIDFNPDDNSPAALLRELMRQTPDAERNSLLSSLVADFWKAAPWSNITPRIQDTEEAQGGVGVALYYYPSYSTIPHVVMVVPNRKDKAVKLQIAGGHINFADKENLIEAALREISEEILDENGPILNDIDPSHLVPLDNMLIYLPNGKPRYVNGMALCLTDEQARRIEQFESRQNEETTLELTKNEIRRIWTIPLRKLVLEPGLLNHPDQHSLFIKLARFLGRDEFIHAYERSKTEKTKPRPA